MEKSFEKMIEDRRKTNTHTAIILIVAAVVAVVLYESLATAQYMAKTAVNPTFWGLLVGYVSGRDIFVEVLIVLSFCGCSWHLRGLQRDDLYTEVIGKSTFALEHFRDLIDAEIERRNENPS